MEESNTRTRINFSLSAKGLVQWDITTEYDTPAKSAEMMKQAIDLVHSVLKEKGLTEVPAAEQK